ncbi:MAG: pseudaminic acid cytidylyltransferase [Muribaculaceae bacterium]|nr:pseudaminic acid cytidylyltransferase [Muribaculaceae bacterium]
MKSIAIIPARGGSKRIPRKNIKDFLGMPIIAYSIKAAVDSGIFDEVMVSTDDEEIAEVAKKYGAAVPFLRSESTSNDYASTADVILEVLEMYARQGMEFEYVACIYATAPFLTPETVRMGMNKIEEGEFDSAFTCVEFSYPVLRSMVINKKGRISMKWPEYQLSRSQDLEKFYHDAGQYYIARTSVYKAQKAFCGLNTAPIVLSELEVQDLDTQTDWEIAEIKYQIIHKY